MYVPPAFRMEDLPELRAVMRAAPLATLVTATEARLLATPLPLFLAEDEGPYGTLHGHLARANPQGSEPAAGRRGPGAVRGTGRLYVTPSWYATKTETGRVVPTWNYVAVHAYGALEFYDDPGCDRWSRG